MPSIENRKFGQYELREVLGRGGMATVYRAYQPNLEREVAIKVMGHQFVDDATFTQRFKREARAIAGLHHPNILTVYDSGEEDGVPYIVSELIDGGTLRQRLGQPLDLKLTSRLLSQLASALDYAHEHGIVHRDVKPSNVLMGHNDRAVLSDFGIVKLLQDQTAKLTATGFGVGTPDYMSPEQGAGEPLDGRSDLYSLGVILYEMLTGVTPFRAETPIAIIMGHIQRPLPDPLKYNPLLLSALVDVLVKILAKKPQDRYATGLELSQAFDQASGLTPAPPASTAPFQLETTVLPAPLEETTALPVRDSATSGTGSATSKLSAPEAYMLALEQEERGNFQIAYETLADIQQREPGYRDVTARLQSYEQANYRYSGQFSLYANDHTTPLTDKTVLESLPPPQASPDLMARKDVSSPSLPISVAPPLPPATNRPHLGLWLGIVGLLLAAIIVVGLLVLGGGTKSPTVSTPTVVAVVPTVTSNPTTTLGNFATTVSNPSSAAGSSATTVLAVLTSAPATTSASAPSITTAFPTSPSTTEAALAELTTITNTLYGPSGDLGTAVPQLKTLADKYPQSSLVQFELGQALYLWNHEAGADIAALQRATQLRPDFARAWAVLALAYRDNYQGVKALDAARRAIALNPDLADAHAAYALALVQDSNGKDEKLKEVTSQLDAARRLDPSGLWTLWAVFGVDTVTQAENSGLTYIEQLIALYPKMATFPNAKGDYYSLLQKYDDAITWYTKALALDAGYGYAHAGLGWVYYIKGDKDKARTELQTAIGQYDNYAYAHDGLGFVLVEDGSFDEAATQFSRAISISLTPVDVLAYNGRATAYISKGISTKDTTTAHQLFNQGIADAKIAFQNSPTYADAYFHAGQGYYLLQDYGQAQGFLKQAIQNDANNANYHAVLADVYFNLKQTADAKNEVSQALKLDPNNPLAQNVQTKLGG